MGGTIQELELPEKTEELRSLCKQQAVQIAQLQHYIQQLRKIVFGPRTERRTLTSEDSAALLPFASLDEHRSQVEAQDGGEEIEVNGHTRKRKGRRKEFPEHLPREDSVFVLPEDLMTCACGCRLREIGEKVTQELERIEHSFVHRIVRKKYSCPKCQDGVITADGLDRVLDRCLLGAAFLAQLIYERFGNHMPYARLEKKYKDEGLDLSRSVLCESVLRCAELLEPIYKEVQREVLSADVVQSDDTQVVQRDGPNKGRRKVFLWTYRDQDGGVFFDVTNKRSRDGPAAILKDRRGYLQCDGHECFDNLGDEVIRVGCWAHMRRKFVEAEDSGDKLAGEAIDLIKRVFDLERVARDRRLKGEGLRAFRQQETKPIVEALFEWIELRHAETASLPRGPLMVAVRYARNQWPTLIRFLDDGRIKDITNNGAERALRPTVVGRKNWAFFGSEEGGRKSAILMSLVNSCKELGINPLLYLRWALRQISKIQASQVDRLTPRGWQREQDVFEEMRRSHQAVSSVVADLLGHDR